MVVYDPWYVLEKKILPINSKEKYIVIPCSYDVDEPIENILESIIENKIQVKFYITGNWKRKPSIIKYANENIIFTGFIIQDKYEELIQNSSGIVTATSREYTAMMSAWEAVAYKKPLILSETITLKNMFKDYAIFFNYQDKKDIAQKILIGLNKQIEEKEWNLMYKTSKLSIDKLHKFLEN